MSFYELIVRMPYLKSAIKVHCDESGCGLKRITRNFCRISCQET